MVKFVVSTQKTRLSTVAALSLLFPAAFAAPALADPSEPASEPLLLSQVSQASDPNNLPTPTAVRGVVESIDGNKVSLRQPWGDKIDVEVSQPRQERVGLKVGSDVAISMRRGVGTLVAQRLCTRQYRTTFVAVEPIRVPPISQSQPAPSALPPRQFAPAPLPPSPTPVPALW